MRGLGAKARGNPLFQRELRRIRRRRWWPGRRFFLFYPALLGIALGFGVLLLLTDWLGVRVLAVGAGAVVGLVLGVVVWLLNIALPWIAPALAAATIARERELGTLDVLRTTLLSGRAIVLGKLMGCLAQLWPGLLLLVLLAPVQVVGALGGRTTCLCPAYPGLTMQVMSLELGVEYFIVSLAIQIVMGMLQPLVDVFFNLALGLFVSVLMRSSGVAIAVSYGVVLAVRVGAWLATSVLGAVVLYALLEVGAIELASGAPTPGMISALLGGLFSNLIPLAVLLAECLGVVGLVWGAIWLLDRE
ncbi:MAG: hypothetical protein JW918_06615 [Anaerolineae bacterium]|nr:hypothetical protein [Anaerolineae bacterium]